MSRQGISEESESQDYVRQSEVLEPDAIIDDGWGLAEIRQDSREPYPVVSEAAQDSLPTEDDGWGKSNDVRLPPRREVDLRDAKADNFDESFDGWGEQPKGDKPTNPSSSTQGAERELASARRAVEAAHREQDQRIATDASSRHTGERLPEFNHGNSLGQFADRSAAREARNLTEASKFSQEALGFERVELSGFSLESANEINAALDSLKTKYRHVDGLRYLGSTQTRILALVTERPDIAKSRPDLVAQPDKCEVAATLRGAAGLSGISFNEEWVGDLPTAQARLRLDEAAGFSARGVGSMRGVVSHEFGHAIENQLLRDGTYDEVAAGIINDIHSRGADWVSENIGEYATKNKQELFAELFAEYECADQPREEALKLGRSIDKYFERSFN
jgi:hypothetical protein